MTGDPEEVPRLMEKEKPHLVLLDLVLPGFDGIEVMQGTLDTADVPVILLSAYGQDDIVARAVDMGAADYMVKPFSPIENIAAAQNPSSTTTGTQSSTLGFVCLLPVS